VVEKAKIAIYYHFLLAILPWIVFISIRTGSAILLLMAAAIHVLITWGFFLSGWSSTVRLVEKPDMAKLPSSNFPFCVFLNKYSIVIFTPRGCMP
jgi:hypothetical protein